MNRWSASELSALILRLADAPTEADQKLLCSAVKNCSLGLRLVEVPPGAVHNQPMLTGPGQEVRVFTAKGPGDVDMLLTFADPELRHRADPRIAYGGVESKAALEMSVSPGLNGILIYGPGDAWAAIPRDGVLRILAEMKNDPDAGR